MGGQVNLGLPRVFRAATDGRQQQWAAGDGLLSDLREGQPGIPAPPVIDQPRSWLRTNLPC